MGGRCLCWQVSFEITGKTSLLYQKTQGSVGPTKGVDAVVLLPI